MVGLLKSRLLIISAIICLATIIFSLGTSNWWTSIAVNWGIYNLDWLANLESVLDTLAVSSIMLCGLVGICLFIYFILSLIISLIRKGKGFTRVIARAIAVVLFFVSIRICWAHILDNTFRTSTLAPYNNELSLSQLTGKYYHGDGLGVNPSLDMTPDAKYTYRWQGCCGIYAGSDGTARLVNGYLTLMPDSIMKEGTGRWGNKMQFYKPNRTENMTFVPIRWGERIYLIEPSNMIHFCIAINKGIEPRHQAHGGYYLREGDWNKYVSERLSALPILPAPWNKLQFNRLRQ